MKLYLTTETSFRLQSGARYAQTGDQLRSDGAGFIAFTKLVVGAAGPAGTQGARGPAGADGMNGADGSDGARGAQGPQGPQGIQGETGPQGPQGPEGPAGSGSGGGTQGPQGPEGPAGPTGPQGPQGAQGPAGADGSDGARGAQGPAGPAGMNGMDGAAGMDGMNGADGARGAQGPAGPQGETGPQGPAGSDGADGADGILGMPSGMVSPYAGSTSPSGWLICNGSAVSRTTYSALFTAIGTTYGNGNGSTTFNIPDLRGRTIVGVNTGTNRMPDNISDLGESGGFHENTLSILEIPSHLHNMHSSHEHRNYHTHGLSDGSSPDTNPNSDSLYYPSNLTENRYRDENVTQLTATTDGAIDEDGNTSPPTTGPNTDFHTATTGGTRPHTVVQPSIVLNYIIKT